MLALSGEKVLYFSDKIIAVKRHNKKVNNRKGDIKIMLDQYEALLTISDLREILNIGRNAVYELLNQGVIPAFRIGRAWKIPKEAVIFYLSQWKTQV